MEIKKIKKRDGKIVDFDKNKLVEAIWKAAQAVGGKDYELAKKLADKVCELLKERLKPNEIPSVELVQDIVEKVLVENGHYKTAKAYILYRALHNQIREFVDSYLEEKSWLVRENANMTYSLQGLNFHISSQVIADYWLHRVYKEKPEIARAHINGDFHIHDLGLLGPYCVGWDLQDLLLSGFTGVRGKISSKPAKHFRVALGQVVNFFFTLQGEAAGAQAFSNFDSYLSPFIAYDNLDYKAVKQALQEFIFNINVPTRVGFQCLSEDTKILTPEGWKSYKELKKGDLIFTFNLHTKELEIKPIKHIFARRYKGIMYNLRNRSQNQLVSPRHRIVRLVFNSKNRYKLEPIEDVLKLRSQIPIPVIAKNNLPDVELSDEEIKLLAWVLSEGSIEKEGSYRVSIYQSYSRYYDEIVGVLNKIGLSFDSRPQFGFGSCQHLRLKPSSSKFVHKLLGAKQKTFPAILFRLSRRQARLFLETYVKGDGWKEKYRKRIVTTDKNILEGLEALAVLAGFNFSVKKRKPRGNSKKVQYVLTLTETKHDYITSIKKVWYDGVIWSVNTDNETVIAKRDGQVFITGNTPFTNITLDLKVPKFMENEPVIIGGKALDKTYGDFQDEMDMFNKALAEVMLEGDAQGRVFTFPIPTINITKDFEWENEAVNKIFEITAKFGIPYFANFINSDMKPEDVRSMCCHLRLDKRELRKRGGGLFGANPLTGCYDETTEVLTENGWKLFKDLSLDDRVFTLNEKNEIELHHPVRIFKYDYDGEMIHFKSKSLDLLVTPNHRMVVDTTNGKRMFVEAKDFVPNTHRIPKGGIWKGKEKQYFVLPPVPIMQGTGPLSRFSESDLRIIRELRKSGQSIYQIAKKFKCSPTTISKIVNNSNYGNKERVKVKSIAPPLKIQMNDWLKFFGFWLAEGSVDNEKIAKTHGYRVIITQVNPKKRKEIKKVLKKLPFNYYEEGPNIIICNKQLWSYLKQFGNKYSKFIPKEIKELSKKQLKILFDWMVKGDGHVRSNGQISYWTASKRLADDLQEIALKLGFMATVIQRNRKISEIKGRKITSHTVYEIGIQKTKHYRLRKRNVKRVYYKGKVYCCEVKNHTLLVRRNGKVSWCGNSIGVVTINMPRLGYLSRNEDEFFERLDRLMLIARESLDIKRKTLEKFTERGLYPYSKFYLRRIKKEFNEYWKNHFSTIGLVGMNECCLNFLNCSIGDKEGLKFAGKVLDFMRKRLQDFQEENGNIYNLEATPAEGTSYRLAKIDKKKYPKIIVANEEAVKKGAEPYYTNSSQLPVYFTDDLFEALTLQDDLQTKYTGGTVFHIYLGERMPGTEAIKSLVRKVCNNFKLPYFTITPTFSVCPFHGYIFGNHAYCPKCEAEGRKTKCEVYSRVVGYLRPVEQWNAGKQEEFKQRKTFDKAIKD